MLWAIWGRRHSAREAGRGMFKRTMLRDYKYNGLYILYWCQVALPVITSNHPGKGCC